ncbi:Endoplasmic reticulum-Golgi intermediate compartment protein 3 [Tritrichomonas musculus]|uniref:Endoplasmic reticulum-Golgi intermediate compartment protein 3 n=1 Tax=Tritrichomonas musculus TaxID=1915356 RepID=A0ABR2KT99_9EUKA
MSLRKFDVFPKLVNEYRVGTVWGGILSLLSLFFAIGLSWVEIHSYLHPQVRQKLIVDSTRPTGEDGVTISMDNLPRLKSFINITFPRAPCYLLHIDVIDSITQISIPLDKVKTTFTRLSPNGQPISILPLDFMNISSSNNNQTKCGSCFIDGTKCCHTCLDVYNTFKDKGVRIPKLDDIPQCSEVRKKINQMDNEGCRVESSFRAVRVGGEFHVAPGLSWFSDGWHVHDLITFGKVFKEVNLTHTITRLQFAKTKGNLPLDNFTLVQSKPNSTWRVVYTADILEDNFSASRYAMYNSTNMIPGIFFKYDVSPITATTYLDKEPKLHLATRLLTVFGAVLGIFRLIDTVIYSASTHTNSKKEEIEH